MCGTGSGFVLDVMGSDGEFCRMVSKHTGAIVLDCDYAKGINISTSRSKCALTSSTIFDFRSAGTSLPRSLRGYLRRGRTRFGKREWAL